eukprot:GFUD01000828.1.p1 GENE.GFUD01000828.1~~GFUD01000828.1.p1  ORF type:complete len:481 (-),score=176.20 GFUD01000828.1:11-1453(-)
MRDSDPMLVYLVLWRWVWAVLSQTWYVPDETWQSVEVAHSVVWGRGFITWEWDEAIRSSLHPTVFIIVFKLLSLLGLDSQWVVVLVPKLLTGTLTAVSDYAVYQMVRRREGTPTAAWFLLLLQTNWFLLYSGSRTIINTVETSLFCLGLSLHPKPLYLSMVSLSVMLRPTIAVAWLPICAAHLLSTLQSRGPTHLVKLSILPLLTVLVVFMIDSLFYGRWTLTPLNFFQVNILHNLGQFYGTHPPYWYLTHALLPILGPLLLPLLLDLPRSPSLVKFPVIITLVFLSLLPHKEMRFIQPLLPLLLYSAARYLNTWVSRPPSSSWVVLMFTMNLPLALYLSLVHQRGVVDASLWLGQSNMRSSLFLMPCHSTPLYSHIHSNTSLDFLSCQPNLSDDPQYRDQADVFYSSPLVWLEQKFPQSEEDSLPASILMFDKLLPQLETFLTGRGYHMIKSFFHSHSAEGRVGHSVLVYCRGVANSDG